MTTTELDDLSALLRRVLPDPGGFAERLIEQIMSRWAIPTPDDFKGFRPKAAPEDLDSKPVVLAPSYEPHSLDALLDSNVLLASALGACDCWGLQDDCIVCEGKGASGWMQPNVELFQAFVGPAVERLADAGLGDDEPPRPTPNGSPNRNTGGENR